MSTTSGRAHRSASSASMCVSGRLHMACCGAAVRRTASGWRDYDEAAAHRARSTADTLAGGLTLDGVKTLKPCLDMHNAADCDDPHLAISTYRARLATVDRRLAALQGRWDELARRLGVLGRGAPWLSEHRADRAFMSRWSQRPRAAGLRGCPRAT